MKLNLFFLGACAGAALLAAHVPLGAQGVHLQDPPTPTAASAVSPAATPVAVRWNSIARALTAGMGHGHGQGGTPILGGRPLALLSVAQLAAIEKLPEGASQRVAVAAASAAVLAHDHAPRAASFEAELAADREAAAAAGASAGSIAAGERAGRAVAQTLLERRAADGHGEIPPFTLQAGEGYWVGSQAAEPIGTHWGKVRPWLLDSPDQFRPAAPPAVGSPELQAALDEVRRTTSGLTPEQKQTAEKWMNPVDGHWNEVAAELIAREQLTEDSGAQVLTLLNVSIMDAAIACFEAKYHYQFPRPSQLDTGISMALMLPNHPAYPSGHSCVTGAAASVLEHYFPLEAERIRATAEEIALSRLYAGVHYRFDNDTGLKIGRAVGARTLELEPKAADLILR